ncbi:hypothetical protein OAL15_02465 [Flavobacteriales bacterium]|nr:hypothetical protein [Flavobacteriales bacterium]
MLHRLHNTVKKLVRLNVDVALLDNRLILKGTTVTNRQVLLTIILPVALSLIFATGTILILAETEFEGVLVLLKLVFGIPLALIYYGVNNAIKLVKTKKHQIYICRGEMIIRTQYVRPIILRTESIEDIIIQLKPNESNVVGMLFVRSANDDIYRLLTVVDSELKYLKDDLEYIRSTILAILGGSDYIINGTS